MQLELARSPWHRPPWWHAGTLPGGPSSPARSPFPRVGCSCLWTWTLDESWGDNDGVEAQVPWWGQWAAFPGDPPLCPSPCLASSSSFALRCTPMAGLRAHGVPRQATDDWGTRGSASGHSDPGTRGPVSGHGGDLGTRSCVRPRKLQAGGGARQLPGRKHCPAPQAKVGHQEILPSRVTAGGKR